MISGNMDFCFKGNRDYVHGTDIFNRISGYIMDNLSITDIDNIDLSIHKIIRKNITFSLYINGNADNDRGEAAAIFSFSRDRDRYKFVLVENDKNIDCRYDYSEEEILKHCDINLTRQSIGINTSTPYSDVEVIVAMNKALLASLYPAASGKWFFTRYSGSRLRSENKFNTLQVTLKHNFKFKLTKSAIAIDGNEKGFIFFSLVS